MEETDLVIGNKGLLIQEFRRLYEIHGSKWRSKLIQINSWHNTGQGLRAWQNTTKRDPNVGNETLRRIIADMQSIISMENKKPLAKRLGFSKPKSIHS